METTIDMTGCTWAIYVGQSKGHRKYLRPRIAAACGIPKARVFFHECADFEADSERARVWLGFDGSEWTGKVLTHRDDLGED